MKWVNIARISKFLEFSGRKKYPGGSRCRDIVVAAQIRPKKATLLFQEKSTPEKILREPPRLSSFDFFASNRSLALGHKVELILVSHFQNIFPFYDLGRIILLGLCCITAGLPLPGITPLCVGKATFIAKAVTDGITTMQRSVGRCLGNRCGKELITVTSWMRQFIF